MKKKLQKAFAIVLALSMLMSLTAYATPYWSSEENGILTEHVVLDSDEIPVEIGAEPEALDADNLAAGSMAAQKFGAFEDEADAANGIVKLTFDVAGKPIELDVSMDVIIIADESGSLNMSGQSAYHTACLNDEHYYRIDGLKEELEKMSALKVAAGGKRVDFVIAEQDRESFIYVNPSEYGLGGLGFRTIYDNHKATLYEMVTEAYEKIYGAYPDNLTQDEILVAIIYNSIRYEKNGTLVKKYGAEPTPLWDEHYALVDGEYVNISEALSGGTFEYDYAGYTGTVIEKAYDYWSPASYQFDYETTNGVYQYEDGHEYGCYDYMIVEKQQAIGLANRVLAENDNNRVAYVGFAQHSFTYQSQNFTNDVDDLADHLNRTTGFSDTNYSSALRAAIALLEARQSDIENSEKPCYVVFISDGAPNQEKGTVATYADELKGLLSGGKVYSIGFKTDNAYLSEIADEGNYYSTSNISEFADAMQVILGGKSYVSPSGVLTDVIGEDFDLLVDEDHPFVVDGAEYASADAAVEAGVTIDGANLSWNLENVDEEGVRISFYVQVDDLTKYNDLLATNADTDEATGANLTYNKLVKDTTVKGYHEEAANIPMETPYLQMTSGQKMSEITMLEDDKETVVPVGYQGEALVAELEGGTMTAQKWGTFATDADAEKGVVNVSFDILGESLEVPGPLDLIVIADESGSLNMYGRADVKANVNSPTTNASYMPCLNDKHFYMVKGLQYELNQIAALRGLTIPAGTESAAADTATFITPHGVAADGVDLAYTVFGHWGKHPALVRELIANAGVVIPEGMTDDDVYRALFSDWDAVAVNNKGKLTFTNLVGWTPDKNHYHAADINSEVPYVENNNTVAETEELYSYWSPADDNAYGCYDRMMIEKEGVAGLVEKIYGQHWDNRVAYVGFTRYAYPSMSSNGMGDSGFCVAENIDYAAGGDAPEALMNVITKTEGHDYTNYNHALLTARKMIDEREDATRPVYVVFISDGVPTTGGSMMGDNAWNILGGDNDTGMDDYANYDDVYPITNDKYAEQMAANGTDRWVEGAKAMAKVFRDFLTTLPEVEFYTVGFNTNATADALLDDMDIDGFTDCADAAEFLKAMEGIRQDIIMVDPDGVLYDEIGADFDFIIDENHPLIVKANQLTADSKWEKNTVSYTSLEAAEEDDRLAFTYVDGKVTAISVALEDVTTAEVSFYEQLKEEFLVPNTSYASPYEIDYYETNETDATLTYHKLVLDKSEAIGYKAEAEATVVNMKTPWVKVEGYYVSSVDLQDGATAEEILEALRDAYAAADTQTVLMCFCVEDHDCCDHSDEDCPVIYGNETETGSVSTMSLRSVVNEEEEDAVVVAPDAKKANNGKGNDKDNFGVGQLKHNAQNNKNGDKHENCKHGHHHHDKNTSEEDDFEGILICDCKCKECRKESKGIHGLLDKGHKDKKDPGPKDKKDPGPKDKKDPGPKDQKDPDPKDKKDPTPKDKKNENNGKNKK